MSAAIGSLDYQGTFVYDHDGQLDALRIFHGGGADSERERLVSLTGPRGEILRNGNSVTWRRIDGDGTLFPNQVGARLLPLVPNTRSPGFSKLYAVRVGKTDRVAGYDARVVDILPRDAYRYGYRLWLDQRTSMLLRSAVVDALGHVLEQFMFVAADIGTRPSAADLASGSEAGTLAEPDETRLDGAANWQARDLPAGFSLVRAQHPAPGPTRTEHLLYSDGVAHVSVYVEPRDAGAPVSADRGAMRGVLSLYWRTAGDWAITVIGDAPPATVQRIARSVEPAQAGSTP